MYILNDVGVKARLDKLRKWFVNGGVVFMGYDMFRNLAISKRTKKKKNREDFQKFLLDPGADMVVCDEGHVMRNSKSSLSLVVNRVKSRLRIVLTGTPLQNNLLECEFVILHFHPFVSAHSHPFYLSLLLPLSYFPSYSPSPSPSPPLPSPSLLLVQTTPW